MQNKPEKLKYPPIQVDMQKVMNLLMKHEGGLKEFGMVISLLLNLHVKEGKITTSKDEQGHTIYTLVDPNAPIDTTGMNKYEKAVEELRAKRKKELEDGSKQV
jgi:hypothetical protein